MPELDFLMLCDHVRAEGAIVHLVAAGIDRIYIEQLPGVVPIGIAARVSFADAVVPADGLPRTELDFQGPDDRTIVSFRGVSSVRDVGAETHPDLLRAILAANIVLPLQDFGRHRLRFLVGGVLLKTIPFVVVDQPPERT
ncbi:hypothetical protein J2S43_006079 [Catenuloplanes nepalensis]|uniref:Uncharacterized protein n=1 Tax=Catenuloplanes nepalensis TaxID=587533 RepID=A0ABT9N1K2_9ACTN|nr:hypothetical protein [Catenuloplanes nepalensis]MDP9797567.1 hypothetical protein [Catenuloplanes nepalensis]